MKMKIKINRMNLSLNLKIKMIIINNLALLKINNNYYNKIFS